MMIRSLISAKLRFHQAYILQKMHPLEVWGLSSAFASLSVFKEYSSPPALPKEIGTVIYDSKMDIEVKYILIILSFERFAKKVRLS